MAAFKAEVFESLHSRAVSTLASSSPSGGKVALQEDAFTQLKEFRDALSRPCAFRGREDTVDLPALARHISSSHPRLATERLAQAVDEVSRSLKLHQHDCCALVEQALDLTTSLAEVPRKCAAIFRRECHFQALCFHDMAQSLVQTPAARYSVAFFAMLGGPKFIKALLESLGLLLRDATGERSGDQDFLCHAGAMIRLYVQTLLAYYFAFQATPDEVEAVLPLLLHVVSAQHAPLAQGPAVSDLDLILREEHADINIKLCFTLVCMCHPQVRGDDWKLDIAKVPESATPSSIRVQDAAAPRDAGGPLAGTPLGAKMQGSDYWNQESQLGQLLCFAISGVLLEDEQALRNGYVHWHIFHFLLHDVLLSGSIVGESCASHLVLKCVHSLLVRALLPVGRRWIAIKKLEAQAVSYRILAPDALQIAVLQALNRLCRAHPASCDAFWTIALYCTDTFHMTAPQGAQLEAAAPDLWSQGLVGRGALVQGRFGAPPRHESTALYYEILDFLASLCARGSLHCAKQVCQKLMSHSNQWFNWNFLMGALVQHTQDAQAMPHLALQGAPAARAAPISAALCRLASAVCSGRLWVSTPPPSPNIQALSLAAGAGAPAADGLAELLSELLGAHPDAAVKTACLGALANLHMSQATARATFASVTGALPTLLAGLGDVRAGQDGALAIELLSCALRLAQSIPIGKGRYALDLQPLTHVVVHHVYMKALGSPSQFASGARYWRLAALALRWLRLVLRGPLPPVGNTQVCAALLEPYADTGPGIAEVAARSANGNATAYAFRCMLTLDSPLFARVLYLTLLCGRVAEGLVGGRGSSAAGPPMRQAALVGMDVLRILFQRDTLFCSLYGQQVAERVAGRGLAGLDAGDLQLVHRPLLSEFGFEYPPPEGDFSSAPASLNPFAGRRIGQGSTAAAQPPATGSSGSAGRRTNPSYAALLLEFIGVAAGPELNRLAVYLLSQCSLREPTTVLRILQLEPWRCKRLSVDLHDLIFQPGEEDSTAASGCQGNWDSQAEAQFLFEAADMDTPPDAAAHLGVASFQTGLPVCLALDAAQQLADDAVAQSADLVAWAQGMGRGRAGLASAGLQSGASTDARRFRMAYIQGLDIHADWLDKHLAGQGLTVPPPVLATATCRLMVLRFLLLLLHGTTPDEAEVEAPKLAQALLGLDPEGAGTGSVDIDVARAAQPLLLDAVMALLENPPPVPLQPESAGPRPSRSTGLQQQGVDAGTAQAVEQHTVYEAALAVFLGLLVAPALRDVALRYMCHAWPSRYQALREILGLPWSVVPVPLRRALLAEASLMLQVVSWEMRLVPPAGVPPVREGQAADFASQQRLDMKRAVAEHLQEVVQSLFSAGEAGQAAHSAAPFLVAAALRLGDAYEPEPARDLSSEALELPQEGLREAVQAARSCCLAVSETGVASLSLELHDPHILLQIMKAGKLWLSGAGAAATDSGGLGAAEATVLREVGARNENACLSFFTKAAFSAMSLFVSAALHHLAHGARLGARDSDPRGQVLRAHLEALLPSLTGPTAVGSPERLALFARLACSLVAAARQAEVPAPLAFVNSLFCALRDCALDPASSAEVRLCMRQSLLLVLQGMLPDPQAEDRAFCARVDSVEMASLSRLAGELVREACTRDTMQDEDCVVAAVPLSLPVLVALLLRVPESQLPAAFPDAGLLSQLAGLLSAPAAPVQDAASRLPLRLQAACVAAVLCRAPVVAAAFFEAGGLAAALRPGFLEALRVRLAPPGLNMLEIPHPALLVALLQMLVALVRALPSHRLALHAVLVWLEQNQKLLLDLLQWVARLPLATAAEPLGAEPPGFGAGPGCSVGDAALLVVCAGGVKERDDGILNVASLALTGWRWAAGTAGAASADSATGQVDGSSRMVALCFCCARLFAELWGALWAALPAGPAGAVARPGAKGQFGQLPSAGSRPPAALDPPRAALSQLGPTMEAALLPLLAQLASAAPLGRGDEPMPDAAAGLPLALTLGPTAGSSGAVLPSAPGTLGTSSSPGPLGASGLPGAGAPAALADASLGALPRRAPAPGDYCPPDSQRLATCVHILQAWRQDEVARQLHLLGESGAATIAAAAAGGMPQIDSWESQATLGSGAAWAATGGPWGAPVMSALAQLTAQVRVRASVLCLVLVHTCTELLRLRFSTVAASWADAGPLGGSARLRFDGSVQRFRVLLHLVEVSLHLLHTHLGALSAAADVGGVATATVATAPAPGPGAPRPALVVRCLRSLRQLSALAGGAVALAAEEPMRPADALPSGALDLTFAAFAAERVEELLLSLQTL